MGRATRSKLEALGVTTAGQLRDMQMKQARGLGTVVLERLVAELQGVAASAVEVVEPQRRGMAVTHRKAPDPRPSTIDRWLGRADFLAAAIAYADDEDGD